MEARLALSMRIVYNIASAIEIFFIMIMNFNSILKADMFLTAHLQYKGCLKSISFALTYF